MIKTRDIDYSQFNQGDPNQWAQDFMAHINARDVTEQLMTEWFRDAMRAAVTYRLINPLRRAE